MKLFGKYDLIPIIAVILLSFLLPLVLLGKQGNILEIKVGDKTEYRRLSENVDFTLENNGIKLEISVKNGKVSVIFSDCPDKICVSTGEISKEGQMIICAPAKISLRITGGENDDYDALIG